MTLCMTADRINSNMQQLWVLDEENMDWSPQTNYRRAHCNTFGTPNLAAVTRGLE